MELMRIIFTMAVTMAVMITLTMRSIGEIGEKPPFEPQTHELSSLHEENNLVLPSRGSRFLAEVIRNPRAADHCHKDNEVCYAYGKNSTCCNNKCMDLSTDNKNCGACKKKCKFTETCCRGQCVDVAYDKRHCGRCNNRCERGQYCVYGMCDYA